MQSPENELKPCPWCNGKAELIDSIKPWVCCSNQDCPSKEMLIHKPGNQINRAIKAWNTRCEPDRTQIRKEVCEEILREMFFKEYWKQMSEFDKGFVSGHNIARKAVLRVKGGENG